MPRLKLSERVSVRVVYEDRSPYGSAVTNRCDQTVRQCCAGIAEYRRQHGLAAVVAHSRKLLAQALAGELADLYTQPGVLHPDWLYPDPQTVQPIALRVEDEVDQLLAELPLTPALIADLAAYLGEWAGGANPPQSQTARELWQALTELGALTAEADLPDLPDLPTLPLPISSTPDTATFVGHATVWLQDRATQILIDPFLLPKSPQYPPGYQPLGLSELGPPSAVLITHSHPDHYDLGSLLRLGADTPIYVPQVVRESVLAVDMLGRLQQLGFRQVQSLDWFQEASIGGMRVIALPFYGEQPTVAEVFHPDVRNQGNTYLVETPKWRVACTADSGQDYGGDVKTLATTALERYGPLDVLFGGYRGFGLYPIQYLFSSVSRYLTFVPPHLWGVRQQMMADATDLIDLGELWQAERIIPYADGGAPWYWLRGLGPVLDGSRPAIMAVDPTPDYVADVAAQRSGAPQGGLVASPVAVQILRPGEGVSLAKNSAIT